VVTSSDPARTVDAEAAPGQAASPAELGLVLLNGPSGSAALSLPWRADEELTIGRDAECSIHLANADVSRRHAALAWNGNEPGIRITDLDSRNGTRVNGHAVRSARLQPNDVLRIGGCVFVVTEGTEPFSEIAPGLLGGAVLQRALAPLQRAARSELSIVLEGETGTGKEVVTRAIHAWSGRTGKVVAINCAALPQGLAEGELFGYRRGAFTGAERASLGFFRNATGGTLLLDEVSDLPLVLQAKLLRALEQKEVQPLGEANPVPVDVRVVVAAQDSLLEAVKKQSFRADLLARLSGLSVRLPPLRQRREDVLPLFLRFMRAVRPSGSPELELEPDVVERLALHDWPFNVRELLQLARRLAVLQGTEAVLRVQHLPPALSERSVPSASDRGSASRPANAGPLESSVQPEPRLAVDLARLMDTLRATGGNVTRAASQLGITRQRAYRLLEEQSVDLTALSGRRRPKR
jgi:transcriptional regulator of acetoin/glycerol metabolism